jgi:hypothetical protein
VGCVKLKCLFLKMWKREWCKVRDDVGRRGRIWDARKESLREGGREGGYRDQMLRSATQVIRKGTSIRLE